MAAEKDDCSCGIAAILESRSQSRTGMTQQMVQHGHAIQASLNIAPHSALPTRHSKSLDQLRIGNFATMPCRSSHREDRKKKRDESEQNTTVDGCGNYYITSTLPIRHQASGRKYPYASRSTVDLAYRKETQARDENYSRHYEYRSQPPRPLSQPQSNTSARTKHRYELTDADGQRYTIEDATLPISSSAKCINDSCSTHFPRSNSTQIFPPNRNELDNAAFHRSTLGLTDRHEERLPSTNGGCRERRPNPPYRRRGSNVVCKRDNYPGDDPSTLPKCRANKCPKDDHVCVKNSSISRYKLSREVTVNSSSTDSESVQNSSSKRLQTSASVPHHLAHQGDRLRHVRSASSVLEELFPLNATASESLPNLIASGARIANVLSLSTSASTSSLTSERSGWVSSHNTSEISSPEIPPSVSHDDMLVVNGEQLRNKLYELITDQNVKDSARPPKPTPDERPVRCTRKKKQIANGKNFSDAYDVAKNKTIEVETTTNGEYVHKTVDHPYIKKEFAQMIPIDNQKEIGGYEELRLPPPKQFRDVPLPPEPFRDPSPGPSPAVDNLLYHVYETIQDDIKKSKSNTDLANKIEGNILKSKFLMILIVCFRFLSN